MKNNECLNIAENTFKFIQKEFSNLRMGIDYDHEFVDLSMDIPKQDGLDFNINLNLQEDELHISTAYFSASFFSILKEDILNNFIAVVSGVINGNYRILQFVNNDKVYKAFIQKNNQSQWITVYRGYERIKMPWTKLNKNIIQNNKGSKLIPIYRASIL